MENTLAIICGVLIIMTGQLWHIHHEMAKRNQLLSKAFSAIEADTKLAQLKDKINDDQTNGKSD